MSERSVALLVLGAQLSFTVGLGLLTHSILGPCLLGLALTWAITALRAA